MFQTAFALRHADEVGRFAWRKYPLYIIQLLRRET